MHDYLCKKGNYLLLFLALKYLFFNALFNTLNHMVWTLILQWKLSFFFKWIFVRVYLVYNAVLLCVLQQSEYVIHIHVSHLFKILFPCGSLQNIEWSSLSYTVGSYQLSVLYVVVYNQKFSNLICLIKKSQENAKISVKNNMAFSFSFSSV